MDIRKFENREEALSTVDLINPNISVIQDEDTILVGVKNLEENASLVISEVGSDKTLSLFPSIMIKYKSNIQLKNPPNILDSKTLVIHTYNEETGIGFLTYNGTITKIDADAFREKQEQNDRLQQIIIPDSVTEIDYNAFYNCNQLSTITIPKMITTIGNRAFFNCEKLENITIPDSISFIGEYAFQDCKGLKTINLWNKITTINEGTFSGCTGLKNITIPDSVINIGDSAFSGCTDIKSVIIPENVETLGDHAFYNCNSDLEVTINSQKLLSKTYTTESNLTNCIDAKSIIIGDNIESLGNYVFYNKNSNSKLSEMTIGTNVDIVTENQVIFNNEDNYNTLETVIIKSTELLTKNYKMPEDEQDYGLKRIFGKKIKTYNIENNTITNIGNYCFSEYNDDNSDPETINLSNKIISIGEGAFYHSRIKEIDLPNSLENIENYCFYGSNITEISIPENVISIGVSSFEYSGLNYITYNSTKITKIEDNTFKDANLKRITLPKNIIYIGKKAFYDNKTQDEILIIPNSVISIDEEAFKKCSIQEISIPNSVTSIGTDAFAECGIIYITWDSKFVYKFSKETDRDNIIKFTFGEHMITIPEEICNDMKYLNVITIPATTTSILGNNEKYAFYGCTRLKIVNWNAKECESRCPGAGEEISEFIVNLGDKVMTLPECFCSENTKLKNITLSNNVRTISKHAFEGCTNLQTINFNENLLTIGESAFSGCTSLGYIEFKSGLKTIGNSAFYNCKKLTFSNLPNNLWEIYDYAFQNCSSISGTLTIVSSINSIGAYAFSGCTSISSIDFGNNTNIGTLNNGIFSECTKLEFFYAQSSKISVLGQNIFNNCKKLHSIHLPSTLESMEYNTLQWCGNGTDNYVYIRYYGNWQSFDKDIWRGRGTSWHVTAKIECNNMTIHRRIIYWP